MEIFNIFLQYLDAFLIFFFRLSEIPIFGYFAGISALGLICVIMGQVTIFALFSVNRTHILKQNQEMVKMQNLSVYSLLSKDKKAFKACNRQANDAFGKVFFSQIALGASSLWPVPFALAWMHTRFENVSFELPFYIPYIGDAVGYSFTFIPMFILMMILFNKVKHQLPIFRNIEKKIDKISQSTQDMVSLADVTTVSQG